MSRGPQTICRLQKRNETGRTSSGGVTASFEDLVQFQGNLMDLTANEQLLFTRQVAVRTKKLRVSPASIGRDNVAEVKEKNRISIPGLNQVYDITGVTARRRSLGKIQHYDLMIMEVN